MLVSINLLASEKQYKIELLIFSQTGVSSEVFDQMDSTIVWPDRLIRLSAIQKVSPQYLNLSSIYAVLARNQSYHPLLHTAWIQSVRKNHLSTAVQITGGEGRINGFVRIQRGHLLHLISDIEYSNGGVIYRINEKRRFKLNEIHYLDHPKFGLLIRISPV